MFNDVNCFVLVGVSLYTLYLYFINWDWCLLIACVIFNIIAWLLYKYDPEPAYYKKQRLERLRGKVIISQPPPWTYTFNALDPVMPTELIDLVLDYQFSSASKSRNFSMWRY
jgi:hypothetical protein